MATQNTNPGNFANDREKASEAGRTGGQHSHSGSAKTDTSATGTGASRSGNFADDRQKASEAGKMGGQASHGTRK